MSMTRSSMAASLAASVDRSGIEPEVCWSRTGASLRSGTDAAGATRGDRDRLGGRTPRPGGREERNAGERPPRPLAMAQPHFGASMAPQARGKQTMANGYGFSDHAALAQDGAASPGRRVDLRRPHRVWHGLRAAGLDAPV